MSLMLKGIDMPTDEKKPIKIEIWASGNVWEKTKGNFICMEKSAIQIPKEHGDIKDVDELKSIKSIQSADFNSIETIQKWIDDVPTILEAEE